MAKKSTMLSAGLRDQVAKIATAQGGSLTKWGNAESAFCSALLAIEAAESAGLDLNPADRKALRSAIEASLREHGVGCNSSQFRQALEALPDGDALLLPKSAASTSSYGEIE